MTVFERCAPFVQDFIYAHRWEKLRSVQVAAGNAVFNTDKHVLLCASTASGKTEADAFSRRQMRGRAFAVLFELEKACERLIAHPETRGK